MTYVLGHAAGLALLGGVVWLAGVALEAAHPRLGEDRGLGGLPRLCLGLAGWTLVLFALAVTGLLTPAWIAGVAIAGAIAGGTVLAARHRRRSAGDAPSDRTATARGAALTTTLAVVLLATAMVPSFLLALSPPVSADAAVYHLTLPRLYLEAGGFRDVALNVYSHWPHATELLYAAALALADYPLAKAAHLGFGLLVLYALWVAGRGRRPEEAWLAMLFFLANGVVAFELRVAYVDLAQAFYLLAGLLFMSRAADGDARALTLAGVCAGLLAGVKITGVVSAVTLAVLYAPRLVAEGLPALRRLGARFALPATVLGALWPLKTAWMTGNPVYPFFYERLGGPDWSSRLGEQLSAWQRSIGMGREALDYLLLPWRVVVEGGRGYARFDGELGLFWLALVPLAAWAVRRDRLARRALIVAGLGFVFWAATAQQARFLIPLLAPLALAAARGLSVLVAAWPRRAGLAARGAIWMAAAAFLAVTYGPLLRPAWNAFGAYRQAGPAMMDSVVPPVFAFVDEHLGADARLLLLNTNQGFFCRREFLADSFFEASQIVDWLSPAKTPEEIRDLLLERNVSHVLLRRPHLVAYPKALWALLRDPATAQPIYRSRDGAVALLELR